MINNKLRAKIEVDDVKSYQQRIPSVITTVFLVDEIVSGTNSTAFAKVAAQANPGDTYIIIKQRTRFFDFEEPLVGSIAGIGASNGSMTTGDELYTNPTYGMDNGLWTLETTGNMISSIDDSVMKINIDQGGNLATGYQFGFTLANFGLVDTIENEGLFLKHLPTRYYIDFGAGYTQVWAGIIDTFPKTGDTTANFKCTDLGKTNTEKIGSDNLPIALNRNYNCKIPRSNEEIKETLFASKVVDGVDIYDNYVLDIDVGRRRISLIGESSGDYELGANDNFENGYIQVTLGEDAGSLYKIYKAEKGAGVNVYYFWVNEDVSNISVALGGQRNNISIVRVVSFSNLYNVSGKEVRLIHDSFNSKVQKPISINSDGLSFALSNPDNYDSFVNGDGVQQISTKSIDSDSKMRVFTKIPLEFDSEEYKFTERLLEVKDVSSQYVVSKEELLKIDEFSKNDQEIYFDFGRLTLTDFFSSLPVSTELVYVLYTVTGTYDSTIITGGYADFLNDSITDTQRLSLMHSRVGNDLRISYDQDLRRSFSSYELIKYFNSSPITRFLVTVSIGFLSDTAQEPSAYSTTEFGFRYGGDLSTDKIGIGCNGENVQAGNEFENYPETFEYIQENYMNIPSANINDASYSQAQDDYDLFPSVTERNPSHQIIAQTDSNTILKDMLKSSHLGLYLSRLGEYSLENWLPKSTVFSDTATIADYTSENWVKENGIGKIDRSQITQVVSDFQLDYDFNEATGEFQNTMRIKNTNLSVFDFDTCTEGVSLQNEEIAAQAWELLRAGYLRAKKETQTTLETKWIKMSFSDGTGESEAINFIRNHAGHVNRELEKVTIRLPLNSTDAILNLLSFVSITDQKRTEGETRPGWIVDHRVSWKSKEVIFRILLDISQFDPFLVQINIIQDDATETEEIQNDPLSTEIIQDGTGK